MIMIELSGDEFQVVRVVCYRCGWHRVIGYTGWKYSRGSWTRALIRITPARSGCNVLTGRIWETTAESPPTSTDTDGAVFRDLQREAYAKGLFRVLAEFDPVISNRPCPRCRLPGSLRLDTYTQPGFDFGRHKSWRISRLPTPPAR